MLLVQRFKTFKIKITIASLKLSLRKNTTYSIKNTVHYENATGNDYS